VLCDVHGDLAGRLRLARFFDHVFLYHRNYVARFADHPPGHVHWLPYACDLEMFKPSGVARDLEIAFIGQLFDDSHERRRIVGRLSERWRMNEQRLYLQDEIPGIYSRAKIVVNLPLADDLNFRTFEALSCGALLLTRRIANGQELLFKEDVHYVAFDDEPELFAKVEHYLSHEAERARIADQGHAEVVAFHGLDVRLRQLLDTVRAGPEPVAPIRRLDARARDREYAWLYEYWGNVDAGLRVASRARRAGRSWLALLLPALRTAVRSARA
jgi:spore maturation protein CgeB